MAFELSDYQTDLETAWIDYDEESSFLIRYSATDEMESASLAKLRRRGMGRLATIDEKVLTDINIEFMADHILVDWKGVYINGKLAQCTRENKILLLRGAKVVRDILYQESRNPKNFRKEAEDIKN